MSHNKGSVAPVMVQEGAFHIPEFLSLTTQNQLIRLCNRLGEQPAGFYRPVLRSGAEMHLRMMCLGLHWNARTYKYQERRDDVDGLEVQRLPSLIINLATVIARSVGMLIAPDIAIVNYYDSAANLGMHQDKNERQHMIESGVPVVSISLGDEAEFLFGGLSRKSPKTQIILRSGDAFVFGGKARLCFHGVRRIRTGTAPTGLDMIGRYNITVRQF